MDTFGDHWQVVKDSLAGDRTIDEHTHASMAVLAERLERVQKLGAQYAGIDFSPAAAKLSSGRSAVAVA